MFNKTEDLKWHFTETTEASRFTSMMMRKTKGKVHKGDVDLEAKLDQWERFYNFARPHGAHNGQTPYEALRERLS